jgi:hypothetical protein
VSVSAAIAHQQDAVGQQDGLVHVVRDHEHGLLRLAHDAHQLVLDGAARQRVQRAKGLVQQQHLGLDGKRPRNAHALLHAARELAGLLVNGRLRPTMRDELFHMHIDLGARPFGPARLDGEGDVLRTVSQGISAWLWNTTPRSRLGPATSRPSMNTLPDWWRCPARPARSGWWSCRNPSGR